MAVRTKATTVDTAAPGPTSARSGVIDLISPHEKLRLTLEPPEMAMSVHGQIREIPGSRKQLVFVQGRCRMRAEWLPLLEERGEFNKDLPGKTIIFRAGDPEAVGASSHGPRVVDGAITANTGQSAPPPLPGWNDMSPVQIRESIRLGGVDDPVGAITYEANHKRREGVLVALMSAAQEQFGVEPGGDGVGLDGGAGDEPVTTLPPDQKVE